MKIISSIILLATAFSLAAAQDFDSQISSAKSTYQSGNFADSRLAVQNAMNQIDIQIGREVLAVLPAKISNMESAKANDQVSGTGDAYVGMFVERKWEKAGAENLTFSIIGDSPLMGSVNAILALPMIGTSGGNQKKVKVEGYKAMLEKKVDENSAATGYSLMLPYGNNMLQLNYAGQITEQDFLTLIQQIPVTKVVTLTQ
jgi:hypothetical protein